MQSNLQVLMYKGSGEVGIDYVPETHYFGLGLVYLKIKARRVAPL